MKPILAVVAIALPLLAACGDANQRLVNNDEYGDYRGSRARNKPQGTNAGLVVFGVDKDREAREAELAKALAEKLGVEQAQVQTALDEIQAERQAERAEALQDRLDQAVTDGTLTQAEADAVTKAVEAGVIGGGGRR